jgi:hypothetical protein
LPSGSPKSRQRELRTSETRWSAENETTVAYKTS